jgi:hypothetical protein
MFADVSWRGGRLMSGAVSAGGMPDQPAEASFQDFVRSFHWSGSQRIWLRVRAQAPRVDASPESKMPVRRHWRNGCTLRRTRVSCATAVNRVASWSRVGRLRIITVTRAGRSVPQAAPFFGTSLSRARREPTPVTRVLTAGGPDEGTLSSTASLTP